MSAQVVCPQCGTAVESHWQWCHSCGFDPEGNRPAGSPIAPGADVIPAAVPASEHPYDDLPYSRDETRPAPPAGPLPPRSGDPLGPSAPMGPRSVAPPPGPTSGPMSGSAPGAGVVASGPVRDQFGPTSGFGPGPSSRPTGGPTGPIGGPAGGFDPSFDPRSAPVGPAAPAAGSSSNVGRVALVMLLVVLVVGAAAVGFVKMTSSDSSNEAKPAPSVSTSALPPMGAVVGNAPSTVAPTGQPPIPGVPTTLAPPADGWLRYRSPDGSFVADYPGQPTVESTFIPARGQQLAALNVIYPVGVDGGGYSVIYVDLPSAAFYADSRAAFETVNERNAAQGRPVFNDAGDVTVDGVAGVRYTGEYHGRPEIGVVVVKGARLYEIDALDVDEASFEKFLAGFHILK